MVRWCGTITTRNSSRPAFAAAPPPGTSYHVLRVMQGIHIILIEIIRLHFVAHQCILRDGKFKRDLFEVIFIERFPDDIGDLLLVKRWITEDRRNQFDLCRLGKSISDFWES